MELMSIDRGDGGSGGRMASRLRLAPGGGEIKKSPPVPTRTHGLRTLNNGRTAPRLLTLGHFFLPSHQCGAAGRWATDDKLLGKIWRNGLLMGDNRPGKERVILRHWTMGFQKRGPPL